MGIKDIQYTNVWGCYTITVGGQNITKRESEIKMMLVSHTSPIQHVIQKMLGDCLLFLESRLRMIVQNANLLCLKPCCVSPSTSRLVSQAHGLPDRLQRRHGSLSTTAAADSREVSPDGRVKCGKRFCAIELGASHWSEFPSSGVGNVRTTEGISALSS